MKNIFISSTCFDLIDLRSELKNYLVKKGLNPIMSDELDTNFIAHYDKNSIETCLINLRDSDMVLFVLSQRYGPSLQKAGFDDLSATHLEYKEAVNQGKKIMVFIRDRLEADYNAYQKIKDPKVLKWIKEDNIKIFEIIKEHSKLVNSTDNNWYWTFRSSVDIKTRLDIQLIEKVRSIKLEDLIKQGNIPFLTVNLERQSPLVDRGNDSRIKAFFTVENFGSQPAIEISMDIFETDKELSEIIKDDIAGTSQKPQWENTCTLINTTEIKSLWPKQQYKDFSKIICFQQTKSLVTRTYIFELSYKIKLGDSLSDISIFKITYDETQKSVVSATIEFIGKAINSEWIYRRFHKL